MEIRDWAMRILSADTMAEKLLEPEALTDALPGPALLWKTPSRPLGMEFSLHSREEKLPPFQDHADPHKRAICLHRFAGHELLAVEIMAYTLLAFPEAPPSFRKGLAHTLHEEQGHVRLYVKRMGELGVQFGDLPLYRHFWMHTPYISSPMHYVSMMSLTFEMANLDFAPMYGKSFMAKGDAESAALMATIVRDEMAHVRFGWQWLRKWKPEKHSEWEAWEHTLTSTLLTPKRARGFYVHEDTRRSAGIPDEWIDKLKNYK